MPLSDVPNQLESVWAQRDPTNQYYAQLNVSGSDIIVYHDSNGVLQADKISVWASTYGLGGGGGSSISCSWASSSYTSSYSPFNGNRPIKRSGYSGLNVGGSDVVDFLNNFFFPFVSATVSIAGNYTYFETGSAPTVTINGNITANDETIWGSGSVLRTGIPWNTIPTIPPYSYTFNDTAVTYSSATNYNTYIQVGNNGTPTILASSTKTVTPVYPYLSGVSSTPGLTGNALYTAMQSHSIVPNVHTTQTPYNYVGSSIYLYYCFPSSYATTLTSVLDPNSFEIISSFQLSSSVPITSSGLTYNWQTTYTVYRWKLPANATGIYKFTQAS